MVSESPKAGSTQRDSRNSINGAIDTWKAGMKGVWERARKCLTLPEWMWVLVKWEEEIYENKCARYGVWSKLQTFVFARVKTYASSSNFPWSADIRCMCPYSQNMLLCNDLLFESISFLQIISSREALSSRHQHKVQFIAAVTMANGEEALINTSA